MRSRDDRPAPGRRDKARAWTRTSPPGAPGDGNGPAYADFFRVLAKPDWFAREKALHDPRTPRGPAHRQGYGAICCRRGVRRGRGIRRRRSHGPPPRRPSCSSCSGCAVASGSADSIAERAVPSAVTALATLLVVRDAWAW